MPLWTDAYLGDTRHLSTFEHGAYLLLLIAAWRRGGSLPDDDAQLAKISGCTRAQWRKVGPLIRDFFKAEDGQLRQSRLIDIYKAVKRKCESASIGGKASALKRQRNRSTNDEIPLADRGNGSATLLNPKVQVKEMSVDISKKNGSRLPADWQPGPEFASFAEGLGHGAEEIAALGDEFRDYWIAQPGQRGVKLDWLATWRNWVRRAGARPKPRKEYVSEGGYQYRGDRKAIKREAERRRDMGTFYAIEGEERREREARSLGDVAAGIVQRARA